MIAPLEPWRGRSPEAHAEEAMRDLIARSGLAVEQRETGDPGVAADLDAPADLDGRGTPGKNGC